MASESIAHSAFGLMGNWLRAHSGSRIVKYSAGNISLRPPRLTLDPEKADTLFLSVQSVQLSKGIFNNSYNFLSRQEL